FTYTHSLQKKEYVPRGLSSGSPKVGSPVTSSVELDEEVVERLGVDAGKWAQVVVSGWK
ncbi:hypothetical protein HDV05_006013, partial [Chytridiales sp. JEL 0842]